jgi:hypothetical protein
MHVMYQQQYVYKKMYVNTDKHTHFTLMFFKNVFYTCFIKIEEGGGHYKLRDPRPPHTHALHAR